MENLSRLSFSPLFSSGASSQALDKSKAPCPVMPLTKMICAPALACLTLNAKTSRSACDTISPFVTTTISAYFSMGPIF